MIKIFKMGWGGGLFLGHSLITIKWTWRFFPQNLDFDLPYKLSIHFGEDKTKFTLFGTKHRLNNVSSLDIRYGEIHIK